MIRHCGGMKWFVIFVCGCLVGGGAMFYFQQPSNPASNYSESKESVGVEPESEEISGGVLEENLVTGDISNIPWQKHISQLYNSLYNGDLYGEKRDKSIDEVLEYLRLCEKNESAGFSFWDNEDEARLKSLFQGYETSVKSLPNPYMDEDVFYRWATKEFWEYCTKIEHSETGNPWEEEGMVVLTGLWGIEHPISSKGLYQFLCENFHTAIKVRTAQAAKHPFRVRDHMIETVLQMKEPVDNEDTPSIELDKEDLLAVEEMRSFLSIKLEILNFIIEGISNEKIKEEARSQFDRAVMKPAELQFFYNSLRDGYSEKYLNSEGVGNDDVFIPCKERDLI